MNAKRDWGHAKDYCFAMWKILQQKQPDDFVIATGKQYSIKQFINIAAKELWNLAKGHYGDIDRTRNMALGKGYRLY